MHFQESIAFSRKHWFKKILIFFFDLFIVFVFLRRQIRMLIFDIHTTVLDISDSSHLHILFPRYFCNLYTLISNADLISISQFPQFWAYLLKLLVGNFSFWRSSSPHLLSWPLSPASVSHTTLTIFTKCPSYWNLNI